MHTPYVLDVTLRDGGYVNSHSWSLPDAIRIVRAAADGGIPAAEAGYFRPERHAADGQTHPAASCPPYYLEKLRATAEGATALVVMAHRKDVPLRRYRDLAELGVSMVRLPLRVNGLDGVADHVAAIHDAGMLASVNLIRVSELRAGQIAHAAAAAGRAGADVFYLADSNGALHPADVTSMLRVVRDATGVPLGFHAHDGLSMAFANSLAALKAGCEYIDASLTGLGKGGGNLIMELLIGYLRAHVGAPFDLAPLARASVGVVAPYRDASPLARCDSIVSSLLNLNLDEIASRRTEAGLLPLLNS